MTASGLVFSLCTLLQIDRCGLLWPMARKRSPRKTTITAEVATEPAVAPRRAGRGASSAKKKPQQPLIAVRHMTRRDINRVWDFLKISFREVNAETVEYQRPRSKHRFEEVYEEAGIEQLLFEVEGDIVAYAECSYEVIGSDNWINPRYFEKRDMRPLFVDELAVHPEMHGRGVGSFVLEQLHHLARVHGLNHLVLEVAENNERALDWYKKRSFKKLDAAIFMACTVVTEPELLPPRELPPVREASPPDEPNESDPSGE
jgi:ribosomal protein S18 acetylase RimI-like enzyme